jgi:hypothetical protein
MRILENLRRKLSGTLIVYDGELGCIRAAQLRTSCFEALEEKTPELLQLRLKNPTFQEGELPETTYCNCRK